MLQVPIFSQKFYCRKRHVAMQKSKQKKREKERKSMRKMDKCPKERKKKEK
jgi:hypothetical protein